ncbi:MAG: hypothetical protein MRQ09_05615 [Candidatus Midichloria sp.]|nr:hypothetical protein [Candidatus Midichloria sp.]
MLGIIERVIISKLYGNNIDQFQGCLSISDIMNKLYGNTGRWITNSSSLLISIVITTSAITAMVL